MDKMLIRVLLNRQQMDIPLRIQEKFIPSAKIQQMKILFPFLVSPEQMEQEILRLIMTNMM